MQLEIKTASRTAPAKLVEALYQRRSVRGFTGEAVTREALSALIDAAIQAPSAMNAQPWSFTVVSDKALLATISKNAKAHMLKELGGEAKSNSFSQMLGDPNFDIFYGAPALVVISAPRDAAWAVEDCAMAAENLMLAAHATGLGTCWIGFAQKWLNTTEGLAAIGLDASQSAVAPIIVGHPKAKTDAVARKIPSVRWV